MGDEWKEFVRDLTPREREVFDYIGKGMRNIDIAEKMGISLLTVRTHAKRVHDKLYIVGRAALAIAAYRTSVEDK